MTRLSLVLTLVACLSMFAGVVFAQDNVGTVRGQIVDTTPAQAPIEGAEVEIIAAGGKEYTATTDAAGKFSRADIPPGRYLISVYREGYGERLGKPVTVVKGGDQYVTIKMTKKDTTPFLRWLWRNITKKKKDTTPANEEKRTFENMQNHPQEHWYNLTVMNNKIGYMYVSTEATEYQGKQATRNKTDIVMNFKALGTDITVEITRVEWIGADLMPLHFRSTSNESGLKQIEGQIVDGIAHVKTTLNGETTESKIPVPPDTISEYTGVASLLTQQGLKMGDKRTFHLFVLDLLKPVKTDLEVLREATLTYQGEEKQVYVLKQTMDMMDGITAKLWIDTDGVNYRTEVPLMGLSMATTKTDKETALGGMEEVDVILKTRILPSGKLPIPKAKHLEAEVKLSTGNIAEIIMSTPRQQLEAHAGGAGKLVIRVPIIVAEDCLQLPIQNGTGEFLTASAYIQADHPDIQAKAKEILGNEVNSWQAAEKLCRWVYAAIDDKKMSGGFASALTALQSRAGDCTEHTVLFIALARAAGIPARICSGIVFAKDAFYYHFWPEVYVGKWVQMDPTLDQVIADANHIQLGGSTLETDNLMEYAADVFRTLNRLEIRVH